MRLASIVFFFALLVAGAANASSQTVSPTPSPVTTNPPVKSADCGCDTPLPEVLALVNGIKITKLDISEKSQKRITELQQEVIAARQGELDMQINSLLLEAEAKKRGLNTIKLLDDEVVSKVAPVTEAEAQAFFEENKPRITGEFKDVRTDIIAFLNEQRQREMAKKLAQGFRATAQVKISRESVTAPAGERERARIFATVNGKNITSGDIEDGLKPLIFSVQDQAYNLRKQDIEMKINGILLDQEARKRAVTIQALLDTEVTAKVSPVSDADAEKFYNENKARIKGELDEVKHQIIQYLNETATRAAESTFASQLWRSAQVQVFLTAPVEPVYQIAIDDQPTKGNPNATVTVVEFTDFQCPSCALQHPILERLIAEYGTQVKFVLRDFPLRQHENAVKAAEAAEAAREQGKFWEYVTLLFRNQSALQVDKLKAYATELKLDRTKFDAALDGGKFRDKVQRDTLDGQKVGVNGTPTLFINGRRIADRSYEGMKAVLDASLKGR